MHLFIEVFGITIPSYGLMIVTGVILANAISMLLLRRNNHDVNDFFILEAYTFLGAFIGAKGLYLFVSYKDIEWNRFLEFDYLNQVMQGGFVFYGGLIGGLLLAVLAGKIHNINVSIYMREYIVLIPLIHGFGRIGCFMAGCCYGIPYSGIGAVQFPENSFAPSGVELFPVQIMEAGVLFVIFGIILLLQILKSWKYTVETYFVLYGIARFILEFYRYDDVRGHFRALSTSQWISILMVMAAVIMVFYKKYFIRE